MKKFYFTILCLGLIFLVSGQAHVFAQGISAEDMAALENSAGKGNPQPASIPAEETPDLPPVENKTQTETSVPALLPVVAEIEVDIWDVFQQLGEQLKNMTAVSSALQKLAKDKNTEESQLTQAYESFNLEIANTKAKADLWNRSAKTIKSRGSEYFTRWQREISGIQNPSLRARAVKSRDQELKIFDMFNVEAQKISDGLSGFISGHEDVSRYLKFNLNLKNLVSASADIKKTISEEAKLQKNIVAATKKLQELTSFSKIMEMKRK